LVPVLREADQKSLRQIALELTNLAGASRSNEILPENLRGATFTISNLGSIGGVHATPIINPPEAAILLAGAARPMPRVINGAIQVRLIMPLSLTYDHRIIDGAVATRFLIHVRESLAIPGVYLLS
jgi:pyruvate dehydrogenase E2 component (dihydrolipoamide acetyltransferase)